MSKYTVKNLTEIEDISGEYPGEVKMLKNPLETTQVAITYRRLPVNTGSIRGSRRGHRHKTQEEVIIVLKGEVTLKLENKKLLMKPWQAIRIAPRVGQDLWNDGPNEAELLIISTRIENLMDDLEIIESFWDEKQSGTPDFTLLDITKESDVLGDYPGEMKILKDSLATKQVAVTFRRMPKGTGSKGFYGHNHKKQEEIIFVRSGTLQVKVGAKIEDIGPNCLIRIAPGTTQGAYNNENKDVEMLIISNRIEPEDKVELDKEFWPA